MLHTFPPVLAALVQVFPDALIVGQTAFSDKPKKFVFFEQKVVLPSQQNACFPAQILYNIDENTG
ncbi:MAG: hypothetical protein PUK55_02840 [Clostridiales bacterium]|nr:hypothetical protein [Clostridiales bacterium]